MNVSICMHVDTTLPSRLCSIYSDGDDVDNNDRDDDDDDDDDDHDDDDDDDFPKMMIMTIHVMSIDDCIQNK